MENERQLREGWTRVEPFRALYDGRILCEVYGKRNLGLLPGMIPMEGLKPQWYYLAWADEGYEITAHESKFQAD